MSTRSKKGSFRSIAPTQSLFALLFVLVWTSCSNSSSSYSAPAGQNVQKQERQTYHKPPSSFADTVTVDAPSAVFFDLDPQQKEKLRSADSVFFKGTVHECFYQMNFSRKTLKAKYPELRIIEVRKGRYLLFKMAGGTQRCIDLDTKNEACGLFIFDGHQDPQLMDMTNLETQLQSYLSQQ